MTRYGYVVEPIIGDGEDRLFEEDSTIDIDRKYNVSDSILRVCCGGGGGGVDQRIDDVHQLHMAVESSGQYCE